MLKNINVYSKIKNGFSTRTSLGKKVVSLALAFSMMTSTGALLTGCNSSVAKIAYEIQYDAENDNDDTLKSLNQDFFDAYFHGDIDECNEDFYNLSTYVVKQLIIEGYNLDRSKIEQFMIYGDHVEDGKNYSNAYGVYIVYDGDEYYLHAKNKLAETIIFDGRSTLQKQFNRHELKCAYNDLYEVLKDFLNPKDKSYTNKCYDMDFLGEKGRYFDGEFTINGYDRTDTDDVVLLPSKKSK